MALARLHNYGIDYDKVPHDTLRESWIEAGRRRIELVTDDLLQRRSEVSPTNFILGEELRDHLMNMLKEQALVRPQQSIRERI
tara:strand:+ start:1153 stop:1401 length:249 start_codon:yes stop_codon:yes gene_type:complete